MMGAIGFGIIGYHFPSTGGLLKLGVDVVGFDENVDDELVGLLMACG